MNEYYTLIQKKEIKELNAIAKEYKHDKSGARLLFILNDDKNKTFSITFRTPPCDNTGLPHILEHSVLCGSRKFPIKDPFVELAKGSLNTFLNAMTFSDKTMYPVASVNDKDFENLMDVYLDAVFYPNIYNEPKILQQEGWHYELNSKEDPITYKGVVYNEMKGAFSSPEQILFRKIQQSLFPDTPYKYESGGDPDYITDLNIDDFLNFHKKYYHPSNSYIFIYGDVNEQQKLEWLHENYLKDFDVQIVDSTINKQVSFNERKEITEYFPISSNESSKEKTYLSLNYVTGDVTNPYEYLGLEILEYILLEAPGAPLKKALIESGIGQDVFGAFDNSILQPTFSIIVKNAEEEDKEKFVEIVEKTLKKLVIDGLSPRNIEAGINYFEFKTKEADFGRYPKGVMYAIKVMDSWLYDNNPLVHLEYNKTFEKLREGINNGAFDQMIKTYLLNCKHSTLFVLKPDKNLLNKKENELKSKLQKYKESLSDEEIEKLISKTKELIKFQSEKETKENLEKIPLLEIDDIKKEIEVIDYEEKEVANIKVLKHEEFTNNIVYIKFLFNTKKVPYHLIPYIGLLKSVLGKVDTINYDYSELSNEININTGGILPDVDVYGMNNEPDVFTPIFSISGKSFLEKLPKLFDLVSEIILNSKFENVKRLKEIILETKSRLQMILNSYGHLTASTKVESYYSKTALYRDMVNGISFYEFLEKIERDFEKHATDIISNLNKLVHILFKPDNLIIGTTSELSGMTLIDKEIEKFIEKLDKGQINLNDIDIEVKQLNEGFMTSDKIQYVAKGGNYIRAGYSYNGVLRVMQTIISLDYLWNQVRVKGGAYGCMANVKRDGSLIFVSYRDPNLRKTLNVYDNMYSYLSTFHSDEREMRKYIIGTISKLDQPLTPSLKNERMLSLYLGNISNENLQKERDEILNATDEDIRKMADLVKDTMKQDNICVIGNELALKDEERLFKEIKHLYN